MILVDNFIGSPITSRTIEFAGSDTQEKFIENCAKLPEDWYYKNKKITYTYNKYGHRCKDISNVDLDNYILFTGCSHTEGIGLELEKTYPYLITNELQTDYYNLAVGGTGIDVLEYNLLTWFAKINKKPKLVIIQWPDHSRFLAQYPGYTNFIPNGTWVKEPDIERFIAASEISGFFYARKNISFRLIHNVIDVPIVGVYLSHLASYDYTSVAVRRCDLARDLQHTGVKTQADMTTRILNHISTLNI